MMGWFEFWTGWATMGRLRQSALMTVRRGAAMYRLCLVRSSLPS